ncbi:MAG TPA: hypothetical protein VGJ60_08025 [Chloroflexota bacterium]
MLLFANAPVSAQPAPGGSTCPAVSLANPGPGDQVPGGDYVVSGVAVDPITRSPSGVGRIDFFLGQRDLGGEFLGTTMPGTDPNNPAGFMTTITFPDVNRQDTFTAYAIAANSAATTTIAVPIQIGSPPRSILAATPTPVALSVTVKSNCPAVTASRAGVAVGTAAPVVSARASQGPVLRLANPSSGDFISRGKYVSFGVAFDPASANGPGVDVVNYFLEPRDAGGEFVGSATPGELGGQLGAFAALLDIPNSASGGHNLVAYAHSTVNGQETAVSTPVFVGVARPTATPTP